MPAPDLYHDGVKNALVREGWVVTHDPYTLTFGQKSVFVDLGAKRIVAAERGAEKIALEIKTFQNALVPGRAGNGFLQHAHGTHRASGAGGLGCVGRLRPRP